MKRIVISLSILLTLFAASQAASGATSLAVYASAAYDPASTLLPGRAAVGLDSIPKEVNPLTGLPAADPSLLERRPIAIKVTNFPRSVRPQWGLSAADHVYEYYIGDQMSRFIGIFYGADASRVGPVRSARLFDEHILRMYRSLLVFGWADDPVLEFLTQPDIRPFLIVERANNCPPLCRIGPKFAYNTLFADTTQIAPYLQDRRINNARQKLTGLRFAAEVPKSGHSAAELSIRYSPISYHRWEYDPTQGRYLRFQETQDDYGKGTAYAPLKDSLTDSQLSAANLVILLAPHEYYIRYSNTDIIDQALEGGGFGYALRDGQIYPLTWEHAAPDQLFKLALPDGRAYPLKPGNTWFEVLSDFSQLKENKSAAWHFDFVLPD